MRVLYAEDSEGLAAGMTAILEMAQHDVMHVSDGAAALHAVDADDAFDILLTDVDMPAMSGIDLIRRLRARRPGLPVVIQSGRADVYVSSLPPGPMAVLRKPSPPEEILAALDRVVSKEHRHEA